MVFSSIAFLYYFLPITLLIYISVPRGMRNAVLLVASLFFYFYGEPVYTVLLLVSSLSDYAQSLYIEANRGTGRAKVALLSSVVINLGMLFFFKYADFVVINLNTIFGWTLPELNLPLPIGISFFTFQTMSYTIDVYRGDVKAEKSLVTMAAYVALFPQLIAGPIVRYKDIAEALHNRRFYFSEVSHGLVRFVIGLGKKVLLANQLGELVAAFGRSGDLSMHYYWLYAIGFSLQIYFDFSGYSDMAIGLGRMFGFAFPENFNYPFISKSITEFWRRWHISLGSWFRDYVYIPLGGNRGGRWMWLRNIAIVWLLTGIWHGAAWNFVLWGGLFGILLVFEKWIGLDRLGRLPAVLRHTYVVLVSVISFAIFGADGLKGVIETLGTMFGLSGLPVFSVESLYQMRSNLPLIIISIVGATPLAKRVYLRLMIDRRVGGVVNLLEPIAIGSMLLLVTAFLVDGSFNPFLYFRF